MVVHPGVVHPGLGRAGRASEISILREIAVQGTGTITCP